MASGPLRICLLGELRLIDADGCTAELPASKKTRALLGYLVATARSHLRERLCELFWDEGSDDPRAALRWSLTKLRPLLDDAKAIRLVADRNRVAFEACGAELDVVTLRGLLGGNLSAAPLEALKAAAGLYTGEFLDGLDLPSCYRYQAWCLAEREALSTLRVSVLSTLIERLDDQPAEALGFARTLVAIDPLSIAGHCAVMRTLDRLGRQPEAFDHYEQATRIIDKEIGAAAGKELHDFARVLQRAAPRRARFDTPARPATAQTQTSSGDPQSDAVFVGRSAERALLDRLVADTRERRTAHVLHVTGEPGIGKSHLLDRLRTRMVSSGGRALCARAFEAEIARPYGIWADIFAGFAHERRAHGAPNLLSALTPELAAAAERPADKARLFARALESLTQVAADQPLVLVLDDLQWIDEGSAALFHYIARTCTAGGAILLACATRAAELEDNPAVANALASLRKERKLRDIALARLTREETAELVRTVDPRLDAERVFANSDGNPLFALELARAKGSEDAEAQRTLRAVIDRELTRLTPDARELLMWAAALGRSFDVEILLALASRPASELLAALAELERRSVLRPGAQSTYDFVHDAVRQVAYHGISQPRRRLLHARIARHLSPLAEADDNIASTVAHHAALSSEHWLAARACVLAAERCLRLFANADARNFAERGLWHLDRLPAGREAAELRIALHKVQAHAAMGPAMRPLPPIAEELTRAIAAAESFGLHEAVMTGHYLLSIIHQEAGRKELAKQSTLRAVTAGRAADSSAYVHQLANTARCLLELETEIPRARALLHEAQLLAAPHSLEYCELEWARGLVERWDGATDLAALSLGRALELARAAADSWREYKCLAWLAMIELERGRAELARAHCADMLQVAHKLGDAEVPLAMTLDALSSGEQRLLVTALQQLRAIDDKSHLAYALNTAASLCLDLGRLELARTYALEALEVAESMQRKNDWAIAHALLLRLEAARATGARTAELERTALDASELSRRARAALREAVQASNGARV